MGASLSWLWNNLFFNPFMNLLLVFYAILGDNLGLAVILMAIVIRIIMIPTTKKQMVMTKKMMDMRPKLEKIQKKFKNNPQELSKEQMKLYKDVGYNPIGCIGTMLPQILILAAIFGVIRTLSDGSFKGLYGPVQSFVFGSGEVVLENLHFLFWDLTSSYTMFQDASMFASERMPYLILGLFVGITQYFSSDFMQKFQGTTPPPKKKDADKDEPMSPEEMQAQMGRTMLMILPVMTAYITISQPAVLGIYWFAQSIMFIVQYFFIDKQRAIEVSREILRLDKVDVLQEESLNQK